MTRSLRWVWLLTLLGACGGRTIDSFPCPDGGTQLTYENFGQAFVGVYCQGCHASNAVSRQGAPSEVTFDSLEQIRRIRERIFLRAAAENDTMPPGPDDPPLEDRMKLAEWLACGAP